MQRAGDEQTDNRPLERFDEHCRAPFCQQTGGRICQRSTLTSLDQKRAVWPSGEVLRLARVSTQILRSRFGFPTRINDVIERNECRARSISSTARGTRFFQNLNPSLCRHAYASTF